MQLSELFLNRQLYRQSQDVSTQDASYNSYTNNQPASNFIASGSNSAIEINNNTVTVNGGKITANSITANQLNFVPVDSTNVVASINASSEGITIIGARISISGLTTFSSGYDPTGKIPLTGAAADVNSNTTTINGGKIRTGQIESTGYSYVSGNFSSAGTQIDLNGSTIRTANFAIDSSGNAYFRGNLTGASGTFSGSLQIGSGSNIVTVDSNGIYLGNSTFGLAPFRVDNAGNLTASSVTLTNASVGSGSSYTGNTIGSTYIANLDASKITTGTLQIGSTNQPGAITIVQSAYNATGLLRWSGGSKLWEDTSNYLGLNSTGERIYFYTSTSALFALFQRYSQAEFYTGVACQGPLNVGNSGSVQNARFTNNVYFDANGSTSAYLWGNGSQLVVAASTYVYTSINGSTALRVSSVGTTSYGYFYSPNSEIIYLGNYSLDMAGSNKTAIVPTSKGFNSLYCVESPEVWFMDFCGPDKVLDIMFKEVTVAPYRYIKCEDGGYQVWGKRKGHQDKRFESKSENDFRANENFLNLNKPRGIETKKGVQGTQSNKPIQSGDDVHLHGVELKSN